MTTQQLTKKNPGTFSWVLTDKDGVTPLTDLATATEIIFNARKAGQEGDAVVPELELKLSTEVGQFSLDDPVVGSLVITVTNTNMDLSSEEFDTFLQVTRASGETLEYKSTVADAGGFQITADGISG